MERLTNDLYTIKANDNTSNYHVKIAATVTLLLLMFA